MGIGGLGYVTGGAEGEEEERKDVKSGEVVLEEKVIVGRETVVKEEKEGVELGADEEDEEDEEEGEEGEGDGGDKFVVEEKDFVEGADANEEENRVRGSEDSIVDACSECWNVESVDGTGGGESSLENEVEEVGRGSFTVSVSVGWKDIWAAGIKLDDGLVISGVMVVEAGTKVVVVEMVSASSTTRFSLALGNSLASGPLP